MSNRPPYPVFPELKSDAILLRELKTEEISEILEILTYDGKHAESISEGEFVRAKIHGNYLEGDGINWVIEDLSSGKLAGFIGYYRGFTNNIGEIGFILKSEFRGKGLMSAAIKLAVAFGIESMKLRQINAYTREENQQAIAVLNRNGFSLDEEKYKDYLVFSRCK